NYVVEGDLQLLGTGSVGLLARVSEAELGEDALKGYFAGVRAVDDSLVLGTFDYIYREAAKIPMQDPVRPLRWYHVRLSVEGCQISASAWALGTAQVKTGRLNDPDCFRSGGIGLRTNGTGGVWRNLRVLPISSVTAAENITPPKSPSMEGVETAHSGVRQPMQPPPDGTPPPIPPQPVETLRYLPPFASPVASIRGSVVLTRPAVYVQDSSGGVEIQSDGPMPVKIGDEVEVTGEVNLDRFSPQIRRARFRLLKEAMPVAPAVLTANQVATGFYDGSFVQVEGSLRATSTDTDGATTLDLDAGVQSFRAILPKGRSRSHIRHIPLESRLRLRGVSVTDARFNRAADPFVILVRSAEDVDVAAGPPWLRGSNLMLASVLGLGLMFAFNHLYLLAKHWRLRAVAEERERLAHEIHDTLAQSFAGIGFQLQAIRNSLTSDSKVLEHQVDLAMVMARTSHEEARRSIASLRPESLGHGGLVNALREYAERMVRNGNVRIETHGEDGGGIVPPRIKDTLFRIGQEAIANSIRHANPSTIRIRLQQQRASLCLSVEDDGHGFLETSDSGGFGLLGMRRRAESISATFSIRSAPGLGTRVEVKAAVGLRFLTRGFLNRS
ncbi:MAG TPA: sensor histidine kinase, partial [Bryobacteraceae bacterium]|nr:sensor histidine kinase [Bryobacteraceae bacterium]